MRVYLAGTQGEVKNGAGRLGDVFLTGSGEYDLCVMARVNILESFYYVKDWQTRNIHNFKSFMLDSGAFTFAYGSGDQVDLGEYLRRYIGYINENDVDLFFELDVDKLVGHERVLEFRRELEGGTGRRCIPVWHLSRGRDEWLRLCDEYDYVALGGLAAKEFRDQERYIPWFTRTAHERGCRVHGLGYTKLRHLQHMGFDSVDSTAWLSGSRGGFVFVRDGFRMGHVGPPPGRRIDPSVAACHNFMQWVELAEDLEGC